jgi:adenosylmethionine-8-amino-7-oxononanoate aminotransferase
METPRTPRKPRYGIGPQSPGPTIVRAHGSTLFTADGDRILDGASGALVCNIGHGRPELAAIAANAIARVDYVLPPWPTPARVALTESLVKDWLPPTFDSVFLACGGSEANDSAIRLARLYHLANGEPQRWKVIGRSPSYHGSTLATLAAGYHRTRRDGFDPLLSEWPKAPWNDAGALAAAIEAAGPETVSAFIAEPVIGAAGGALVASNDYWAEVSEVLKHYGVLGISDEVMTGFGRTGKKWGFDHDPWSPDILVSGKGLGGGYVPISVVAANDRVADALAKGSSQLMFFTYSGHDLTCAVADEVLRILRDEQLVARAHTMGERLRAGLVRELGSLEQVVEIRGRGLMLGVELSGITAASVVGQCLKMGLWVYPSGSGGPVPESILVAPPLVVTNNEVDQIVSTLAAVLA